MGTYTFCKSVRPHLRLPLSPFISLGQFQFSGIQLVIRSFLCDQILMIAHGKLAAFGAPDELESRLLTPNEITLTAEGTEEQVRALLDGIGAITGRSITAEEGGLVTARLKTGREASLHDVSRALFFAFAGAGVPLLEMALKKANLEDIFIELTEQSAEAPAAAEGEEGQA